PGLRGPKPFRPPCERAMWRNATLRCPTPDFPIPPKTSPERKGSADDELQGPDLSQPSQSSLIFDLFAGVTRPAASERPESSFRIRTAVVPKVVSSLSMNRIRWGYAAFPIALIFWNSKYSGVFEFVKPPDWQFRNVCSHGSVAGFVADTRGAAGSVPAVLPPLLPQVEAISCACRVYHHVAPKVYSPARVSGELKLLMM